MKSVELLNFLMNKLEFDIICCYSIRHDKKWSECESKDSYDIWLITDGEIEIEMDGEAAVLKKGDTFLFYPNIMYSAYSKSEACTFIFIRFDIFLAKNIHPLNDFKLYGHIDSAYITDESRDFVNAFENYRKNELLSGLTLKGCLILLFSKIIAVKKDFTNGNAKSPYLKLEKALSFINKNINEKILVKCVAGYLCMSEKYFITYFKKYMGITPLSYINVQKLKLAMRYLNNQKYSIKETAFLLGYSDQYTFSKAFKRYYGFSPSNVK